MASLGREDTGVSAKGTRSRQRRKPDFEEVIAISVEKLISEGHSFKDIRKYSIPQLMLFQMLIGLRYARQYEAEEDALKKADGSKAPVTKGSYLPGANVRRQVAGSRRK